MTLRLNVSQDIEHGITVIFICCVMIIIAALLDLNTGVKAARKAKEKIRSRTLRHTVTKIIDYLRVLAFAVMIDVLGLSFPWYNVPYCAIICTLGVLLIEAKSVLENYNKMKSSARVLPDVIKEIVACATDGKARDIVEKIKNGHYEQILHAGGDDTLNNRP